MLAARSVQSRFQGTGTVSTKAALDIGLVGLAARASGVPVDARSDLPGRLYAEHPIDMLTESSRRLLGPPAAAHARDRGIAALAGPRAGRTGSWT